MSINLVFDWTPAEDDILREGRAEGLSYATLARRLGRTRNSCISRARRTRIPSPSKPVVEALPAAPPVTQCQYIHGDPRKPDHRYCGDPVVKKGRPYCASHMAVTYVRYKDAAAVDQAVEAKLAKVLKDIEREGRELKE